MANNSFSLFLLVVGFVLCACDAIRVQPKDLGEKQKKDFCVARLYALRIDLQNYLDYACGKYDCSAIQPNASCFLPDDLIRHTSYALDSEYRTTGVCNKKVGLITKRDPSYNDCHYP